MDLLFPVLLIGAIVAVIIGVEVREGQARGSGLDVDEVVSRIGKLDAEGRKAFLFALGPRLGSPKNRTRLIEIHNSQAIIQSLDGAVQLQGYLRSARWGWFQGDGWGIELVMEVRSQDGPIYRTVRGKMSRSEAKQWPELADGPL